MCLKYIINLNVVFTYIKVIPHILKSIYSKVGKFAVPFEGKLALPFEGKLARVTNSTRETSLRPKDFFLKLIQGLII